MNEAVIEYLADYLLPEGVSETSEEYKAAQKRLIAASQVLGVLTASASGGDVNVAATIAQNATAYNYLRHEDVRRLVKALDGCVSPEACQAIRDEFKAVSDSNRKRLAQCKGNNNCDQIEQEIAGGRQAMDDAKGLAYEFLKQDFIDRQISDRMTVEKAQLDIGYDKANKAVDDDNLRQAQALKKLLEDPAAVKARIDHMAKEAYQKEQEATVAAETEKARLELAERLRMEQLVPGRAAYINEILQVTGAVKTGGVIVSSILEPDAFSALGPTAKLAEITRVLSALGKVVDKAPTELTKAVSKLNELVAGKPPTTAELEPFKKAAGSKLAEDIRIANQSLAGKKTPNTLNGNSKTLADGKPTVELFGGRNAQTPGAINVDIRADIQSGIRADATKLPFKDGSLGEVIATNPYMGPGGSMMDFLPEATRVVEPGGRIYINANDANRYGRLPSQADLESLGLRVVQNDGTLDARFVGQTFFQSDGVKPVKNISSMKTIVLERVK